MRGFLLWFVCDSGYCPIKLAPWLFGLAIGRMPHKVKDGEVNGK